ncbi:hypothetical protein PsorP6_013877 [Peronosclerospora sorghi]|uniref:Uncharacterized protein n=1 Tax=Peronosclerospora sorghi TaxID=230839 RepID=A0ACC0VGZ5_9STRA|nr:hypothetical protein PsorP6_013877 [Peronosclerospora sorghi]
MVGRLSQIERELSFLELDDVPDISRAESLGMRPKRANREALMSTSITMMNSTNIHLMPVHLSPLFACDLFVKSQSSQILLVS